MKAIFLLVLFLSCTPNEVIAPEKPVAPPVEVVPEEEGPREPSPEIGTEYSVANVRKVFTVKIVATNYNEDQKKKLAEAERIIAKVFNSEAYKSAVLSKKFTSTKLSAAQVYEELFEGAEALVPAKNYQMDLTVTMYYKNNKTVGYTYPSKMTVYTNSKFHDRYTACQIAGNLVHEWTHKMGFGHSSASDRSSVPYAHNKIVESLCNL
jgi:hypothetical protein